jgi:glc operon protein GlcG
MAKADLREREDKMKMRILGMGLLSAAAAVAIVAGASAQNVPAEFVVSGDTAAEILDYTTINLQTAERIAQACERLAVEEGVQVSIHILDNDGNTVYMHRMDGQGWIQIATAEMKARTALMGRTPSKERMNRVIENPLVEFQQIQLGFFPNSGGLPIVVDNQLIGAIGVGGSAPRVAEGWSDEICAHKALTEVIGPQPPLLEDLPPAPRAEVANPVPVPQFRIPGPPASGLPAEFVVSGEAAGRILDGNQISGDAARRVAAACRAFAAENGGTMSLFIIDPAGNLVHSERMDGQVYNNMNTALLKAETALKTKQPTSVRAAGLRNDPAGMPRSVFWYNFYAVPGGLPIVVDGQIIGAIGVGGGAGAGDEPCAIAGLRAVFGDRVTVPVYPDAG